MIGQGTWNMEHDDRATAIAAIRHGIELGLTHIDTAEMYGSGRVEKLLKGALDGLRDRVFLVSKVLPSNASYKGTIKACEDSLKRMGTEHLDLYLLHWSSNHPLEETIRAFDKLEQAGKIRAFGVSNFDVEEMTQAVKLAGDGRVACNQVLYHLEERDIEHELIPWCREHDVPIVAYSPFGSGRFPSPTSRGGMALAEIAQETDSTPRAVALSFLCKDGALAIPKSSKTPHVEQNAKALDLVLPEPAVKKLANAFPLGPKRRHLPTI